MRQVETSFEIIMLVKEISSAVNSKIGTNMKESGLTPQQVMVIKIIAHSKEATMTRLCEELSLAKATVSGMIKRLEDMGYVEKVKKEEDKRNTYIILSEKGNELAYAFRKEMNHSFCAVLEHLSEEEIMQVKSALTLLRDKMKEAII